MLGLPGERQTGFGRLADGVRAADRSLTSGVVATRTHGTHSILTVTQFIMFQTVSGCCLLFRAAAVKPTAVLEA